MFAAIYIPDFPVEAIVRLKPGLRERPVAVMEGTAPLLRVIAVNERAADAGLEPGMPKLQAEGHAAVCNGVLAMRSPEQEASAQAALLDAACGFSPCVEDAAPGLVVIDLDGLERIFGPAAKIARDLARRCSEIELEAQVAVASNPDAAIHAARGFSGVTVIPEGREAERLATLPVEVLAVTPLPAAIENQKSKIENQKSPDLLNTLESWGIRNLRALAALPEIAVTERLGQSGLLWQRMARGASQRTLKPIEPPARFEESCELEYPVESLEPLSFLLNRMLEQLCARLSARALATNELLVTLKVEDVDDMEVSSDLKFEICNLQSNDDLGSSANCKLPVTNYKSREAFFTRALCLPVPMLDAKVFLKLLQLDLQAHPPGAPVVKIFIAATPAEPRRTQNGLFQPSAPEPERLEVTLARIQSTVAGRQLPEENNRQSAIDNRQCSSKEARVGMAEILDTHRPDSLRMNRFMAGLVPQARQFIARHVSAGSASAPLPSPVRDGTASGRVPHPDRCWKGREVPVTALRLMRPPLAAHVTLRAGKPARIECDSVTGDITWAAGPWKSSGDWWSDQTWSREEWDVCVGEACYRIYREPKGWFVEGTYD
jgi:protein ImuB